MTKFRLILLHIALLLCLNLNLYYGYETTSDPFRAQCDEFQSKLIETNATDTLHLCKEENKSTSGDQLCTSFNKLHSFLCEKNVSDKLNYCEVIVNSTKMVVEGGKAVTISCTDLCLNKNENQMLELCQKAQPTVTKGASPITTTTTTPTSVTSTLSKLATTTTTTTTSTTPSKLATITTTTTTSAPSKLTTITTKLVSSTKSQIPVNKNTDIETQETKSNRLADGYDGADDLPSLANPTNVVMTEVDEDDAINEMEDDADPFLPKDPDEKKTYTSEDRTGKQVGTFGVGDPDDGNSHFFVYFLTVVVLCIMGYVLYHNKKKVIALIVEGRQERRRRPNTNLYRKLDSNLEEVMLSSGTDSKTSRIRFARNKGPDEFWRKRKIFKLTAHLYGRSRNCYSLAIRAYYKSMQQAALGRLMKKVDRKELWQRRIGAASNELGTEYSTVMEGLVRSNIDINNKVLTDLAIYEPRTFQALAKVGQMKMFQETKKGLNSIDEPPAGVITRGML
ncbi:hypothetical protein CHUAL_007710 [Chamberlinius hualienensis]